MLKIKEPFWFHPNDEYHDSEVVCNSIDTKFVNFKATVIQNTDEFFILDWKNKDGSNDHAIRYIVDKKQGTFIVYGDLDSCVAEWYSPLDPCELASYIRDIHYFIEKVTSGTTEWHDDELAIQQLEEQKEEFLEAETDPHYINEIESDFDELIESYDGKYSVLNDRFYDPYFKYVEAGAIPPLDLGAYIPPRVFLWAAGYILACEQLGLIEIDREENS